jgi:hypothetical protein
VNTCEQVAVFPHASVAVYVRIWVKTQPAFAEGAKTLVMTGVLQPSVAIAKPGAGTLVGLQPKLRPDGQNVNVGTVVSTVQVNTCVQVAVLPAASVAV